MIWKNSSRTADGKPLHGTVRQDIRILPPTPRNVARASVTVPAGFRSVPDGSFGGPVFPYSGGTDEAARIGCRDSRSHPISHAMGARFMISAGPVQASEQTTLHTWAHPSIGLLSRPACVSGISAAVGSAGDQAGRTGRACLGGFMRVTRWHLQRGVLVVAGVAAALSTAPGIPVASAATVPGPVVRLEAAQRSITLDRFGGKVFLDPGIWVAALGSPLQFDVRRMPYTSPITITQIIHAPFGGIVRRPLPASILDGWNGLRRFIRLTARNAAGKVVVSQQVTFCPDSYQPARVRPASPPTSPYPQQCPTVPFAKGMVWGVQKGWAIDPVQTDFFGPGPVKLPLGVYRVTETISSVYRRLFGISARDATATVTVKVVKGRARSATAHPPRTPGSLPSAPAVPYLKQPPRPRCLIWWRCQPGRSAPAIQARVIFLTSRRRCGSAATALLMSRASGLTLRRS